MSSYEKKYSIVGGAALAILLLVLYVPRVQPVSANFETNVDYWSWIAKAHGNENETIFFNQVFSFAHTKKYVAAVSIIEARDVDYVEKPDFGNLYAFMLKKTKRYERAYQILQEIENNYAVGGDLTFQQQRDLAERKMLIAELTIALLGDVAPLFERIQALGPDKVGAYDLAKLSAIHEIRGEGKKSDLVFSEAKAIAHYFQLAELEVKRSEILDLYFLAQEKNKLEIKWD